MPSFWDIHGRLGRDRRGTGDEGGPPSSRRGAGGSRKPRAGNGRGGGDRGRGGDGGHDGGGGSAGAITVSQLTARVKSALQQGIPGQIAVRGEISEWTNAPSGHRYFCLKDDSTSLNCVMWRSAAARSLRFEPEVGQEIIAFGRIDVYPSRGQYQLNCERVEPAGAGALDLAFRRLRERLDREGLFDAGRKRPLPRFPERVCIVTSARAAGFEDVLKVLRACGHLKLFHYDVPVQGDGAALRIAEALRHISSRHRDVGGIDILLLVRGGGSPEDLWAFNEEPVVRALAEMSLPVITGIGHQTDRTLADLAADFEAHTPTEAAQTLVREWKNARNQVERMGVVLRRDWKQLQGERRERLRACVRHETFRRPAELVDLRRRRVDEMSFKLAGALRRLARGTAERLRGLAGVLDRAHPRAALERDRRRAIELGNRLRNAWYDVHDERAQRVAKVARGGEHALRRQVAQATRVVVELRHRLERRGPQLRLQVTVATLAGFEDRLRRAARRVAESRGARLSALGGKLGALDPTAVLGRGYSITFLNRTGTVVRAAAEARPGDVLTTRTADGDIRSTVGRAGQGELF